VSAKGAFRLGAILNEAVGKVESASSLDRVANAFRSPSSFLLGNRPLRDMLSGSYFGHPLHPVLTDLPIGCWAGSAILDLTDNQPEAARRLIGTGIVMAVPTALAGVSDWLDTDGSEQRVGLVHGLGNLIGIAFMAGSWLQRRNGARGRALAAVGLVAMWVSGWLGGHLSFAMGVGVDVNAFQSGPEDWTPTTPCEGPEGEGVACREVDGVRIAVITTDGGKYALADRCSHRGGPLSEGEADGGCIVCPWHGSAFDIRTGEVVQGPASMPQPTYEVRDGAAGIEARRSEQRALRRNPV